MQIVSSNSNAVQNHLKGMDVEGFSALSVSQITFQQPVMSGVRMSEMVKRLENVLSQGSYKDQDIFDQVQWLMENYDASCKDYAKYAIRTDADHYSRNLIKKGDGFALMLLVWPPNIDSPIHDHGGSECWLRVASGALEERFYERTDDDAQTFQADKLVKKFSQVHQAGEVCFINDDQGLHAIANPSKDTWAISLHCYVPGFEECNALVNGKVKKCKMSFSTVDGRKVQ